MYCHSIKFTVTVGQRLSDTDQTLQVLDSFGPLTIFRVCSNHKWSDGGEAYNNEPSCLGASPNF